MAYDVFIKEQAEYPDPDDYQAALTELVDAINNASPQDVVIDLNGEQLMQRAKSYFDSGQRELAARVYLLALRDPDLRLRARAARFLRESKVPANFDKVLEPCHMKNILKCWRV
jgi:hypothetical protein